MSDPVITMVYGSYNFSPVPPIALAKEYTRTADGTIIGSVMKVSLDGTLYAPTGGVSNIIALQSGLRSAFDRDGKLFQISCNGSPLLTCYPRINGPNFPPTSNNWVMTSTYTIELEFDDEPGPTSGFGVLGENTGIMPPFIRDASESWSIEFVEDKAYYNLTLPTGVADTSPVQLRLTHNVSAVGKKRYTGAGLEHEAWQNARQYVLPKLGYDSSVLAASGVLNIGSGVYGAYNHMRNNSIDESAGSYSVVETWLLVNSGNGIAGRAIEDYTVDVRKSIESDLTTVTIQGSIQGLETRTYGTNPGDFTIVESKIAAASGYWNTIKGSLKLYPRAVLFSNGLTTRPLNSFSTSNSFGYNPSNGTIVYTYEYNDRPSNCIAAALTENISISDTNATDVFGEIGIPGRSAGPLLQDMNTVTLRKRDINIDIVVAPPTGCGYTALYTTNNPRSSVDTIFNYFYAELTGAYSQVFKHADNEVWEPKTGRYSATRGWTYTNCT